MSGIPRLRPITEAKIAVVPAGQRDAAFAKLARLPGRPGLRPVGRAPLLVGSPANDDVILGLFARTGYSPVFELAGLVALRERYAHQIAVAPSHPIRRVFLIEALNVSESMLHWEPPVRALLAATAAVLAATISHDPTYETFVVCRAPPGDLLVEEAIEMLGGQSVALLPGMAAPELSFGNIPSSDLRFLDAQAAARCADLVARHMSGAIQPSMLVELPGATYRAYEGMLTLEFPRLLRSLSGEIEAIADSRVDLGWRVPAVAGNDVSFPLQFAANAART